MSTYLADEDFEFLRIERTNSVAFVTIDAPPMNVMTPSLFRELAKFGAQVSTDDSVIVIVLRSNDPDFFIAHFDVSAILEFPVEGPAEKPEELAGFHLMCEPIEPCRRLRSPKSEAELAAVGANCQCHATCGLVH